MSKRSVQMSAIFLTAASLFGISCAAHTGKDDISREVGVAPPTVGPMTEETKAQAQTAANASNTFALKLLPELTKQPSENVFYSPTSLSLALSLAAAGASGKTQSALNTGLGITDGTNRDRDNAALQQALLQPDPKVALNVSNAVWSDTNFAFRPEYVTQVGTFYNAGAKSLTLSDPKSADIINEWVAAGTNDKIKQIVSPEAIAGATAVLTNAVYFNGKWSEPFEKSDTKDHDFTPAGGIAYAVPMMHQTKRLGYLGNVPNVTVQEGAGVAGNYPFEAVRLPYGAGKWAMYAFLPKSGTTLEKLIQTFTPEKWAVWKKAFVRREVEVGLPRFKADYFASMKKPLSDVGMAQAFSDNADFSPMFVSGSHRIDDVLHKAVLEVKEEGTEAAAATAVMMATSAAMPAPKPVVIFDRPFLCLIVNEESGAIVFIGAIRKPAAL